MAGSFTSETVDVAQWAADAAAAAATNAQGGPDEVFAAAVAAARQAGADQDYAEEAADLAQQHVAKQVSSAEI